MAIQIIARITKLFSDLFYQTRLILLRGGGLSKALYIVERIHKNLYVSGRVEDHQQLRLPNKIFSNRQILLFCL